MTISIIGKDAAEIARRVAKPIYRDWTEVKVMDECKHGCKLYARRRGCVTQYELVHFKSYGCDLARSPETARVKVRVAPKATPPIAYAAVRSSKEQAMTNPAAQSFAVLGLSTEGAWSVLDSGIGSLAGALKQAQAWRVSVVDLPVVVSGTSGIVWRDGQIEVGNVVRIANFDVVYEGVVRQTKGVIALSDYRAWYEGADGPYVAPAGDMVTLKLDEDATVEVAA